MARPIFALVDCDHFYVSCERVFQPRLEAQPVVVLERDLFESGYATRFNRGAGLYFDL